MPWSIIQLLQRVMNAAARVIVNLSIRDHVKPALKELHWLPVEQRINYVQILSAHAFNSLHPAGTAIFERFVHLQFLQPTVDIC